MSRPATPQLAPVTLVSLLAGRRRAALCEAYLARATFAGFRLAKAGGWL